MNRKWFDDDDQGLVVGGFREDGTFVVGHPGDGANDADTALFGGDTAIALADAARTAGRLVDVEEGFLGNP